MKYQISLLVFFFSYNIACATITINIVNPVSNQVSDSTLAVQANIQSTYEITNVIAAINGQQAILTYNSSTSDFEGNISLAGLSKGSPLNLIVTAIDFLQNQTSDSVYIIYDPPPVVDIVLPINWSNIFPSIPVKAACSGDSCQFNVSISLNDYPVYNQNFQNSIDTVISIQPGIDNNGKIIFTATDKWGQTTRVSRPVFFDDNPYLKEIYEVNGQIFDFNYNKLLVNNGNGQIVNIETGDSVNITGNEPLTDEAASLLTPYGAFYGNQDIYGNVRVFDWNNDSLYPAAGGYAYSTPDNPFIIKTNGKYASFEVTQNGTSPMLFLRDLSEKEDTQLVIGYNASAYLNNDIALNNLFVYNDGSFNILQIKDGVTTTLINNNVNISPLTDGNYIIYAKTINDLNYYVYMYDGTSEIQLSNLNSNYPQPGTNYQVNNKYVAYSNPDISGQLQVWLRDSTGANSQVTFFSTSSTIELLNPNGDVMFNSNGERYLATKGVLLPKDLGQGAGRLFYRDSSWYVIEGRDLYKLLVNAYITVADGDWNNPATWENNTIPPANADVIIKNNVVVSSNETANSLKVISPGSVNVLSGFNVTILH